MQELFSAILDLLKSFSLGTFFCKNLVSKMNNDCTVVGGGGRILLHWEKSASGNAFLMTSLNPPCWLIIVMPPWIFYQLSVRLRSWMKKEKEESKYAPVGWLRCNQENPKNGSREDRILFLSQSLQGISCSCECHSSSLSYGGHDICAGLHLPSPTNIIGKAQGGNGTQYIPHLASVCIKAYLMMQWVSMRADE